MNPHAFLSYFFLLLPRTRNYSWVEGAFRNIQNDIHKQPDRTNNICSVRESNLHSSGSLSHCGNRADRRQLLFWLFRKPIIKKKNTRCIVPQITPSVALLIRGNRSVLSLATSFSTVFTRSWACSQKVMKNLFKIRKWNAGVSILRRRCHFSPEKRIMSILKTWSKTWLRTQVGPVIDSRVE